MLKHTPLVRKFTYITGFTSIILGVLSIAGILIYQNWFLPEGARCQKWTQEVILPQDIQGSVNSIRPAGSDNPCQVLLEVNGFGDLLWCTCEMDSSLPNSSISLGDSIYKPKNSLLVTLCSSDSFCATFDFPCCD